MNWKKVSHFFRHTRCCKKEYAVLSHYGGCRDGGGLGIAEAPGSVMRDVSWVSYKKKVGAKRVVYPKTIIPVIWYLFSLHETLYLKYFSSFIVSDLLLMIADTGSWFSFKFPWCGGIDPNGSTVVVMNDILVVILNY